MSNLTLKKLYKTGAFFQALLAIFVIVFAFPSFLNLGFGADILKWREFTEKVFNTSANLWVCGIIHGTVFVLFFANLMSLFVFRGLSNLFFKISITFCSFPFAMYSLNYVLACFGVSTNILFWFSQTLLYVFFGLGAILFLLGFVFLILENKRKMCKTTTYLIAKAFLWLVLALFNFVAVAPLSNAGFLAVFAYFGILFPYFLIWMLPVLCIWQFVCGFTIKDTSSSKKEEQSNRPVYKG